MDSGIFKSAVFTEDPFNTLQLAIRIALVVLLFAVLHRAAESQPARDSCPRFAFFDSRFVLYHVAVVLSFIRS